jgi:tRNA pseudouridine13 synthase
MEALAQAEAIATMLRQQGVPNFFGMQRFGLHGTNVEKGLALLHNKRRERDPWLRKFLISAYQSYLCNRYLTQRLAMGAFDHLLLGDVAKKHDTGGMFAVTDLAAEQPRYAAQEISFTAPLYGAKMWAAQDEAGALEQAIEAEAALSTEQWQKVKVDGTRRYGRILLPELSITPKILTGHLGATGEQATEEEGNACEQEALEFTFVLPKGAFATVVLREFMKVDLTTVTGVDSDTE